MTNPVLTIPEVPDIMLSRQPQSVQLAYASSSTHLPKFLIWFVHNRVTYRTYKRMAVLWYSETLLLAKQHKTQECIRDCFFPSLCCFSNKRRFSPYHTEVILRDSYWIYSVLKGKLTVTSIALFLWKMHALYGV